jgi:hypothetical protein
MVNDLTKRTFNFSKSIILYCDLLPKTAAGRASAIARLPKVEVCAVPCLTSDF